MASTEAPVDLKSIFLEMVRAASVAPSPDNNQPWRFQLTDKGLAVFLDASRSLPSDVMSMFDMTALGAATENALIAAAEHGFSSNVVWKPNELRDEAAHQAIAELRLSPGGTPDPLFSAINTRCTCRKPYSDSPLAPEVLRQLNLSCKPFPDIQIDWLTTRDEKKKFGKLLATTDSLRFQHRPFHEELFKQLRFQKTEVESTNDGLDVRTLELPFGVATALRCLSSWSVMNLVHQLRMTSLLTIPSMVSVQKSGAIAILSVPEPSMEAFFTGGRAIERFWLAGASLGLSMHPLGSLPIFLLQPDPRPEFRSAIEKARRGVHTLFPQLGERVIQLGMRVGFSDPPSERSRRRAPDDVMVGKQTT